MNILVLNGSPKGRNSITLQTVRYLEKRNPEHTFEVLHVGQKIKSIEKDFAPARAAIDRAEVLLFTYPVYTFIAPSQLHRFIELMKQEKVDLSGKFASQITTSKRFYDITAHRYIQDNAQDMGAKFIRGLSADMDDLLTKKGQKEADDFFSFLYWSVACDVYEPIPAPLGEPAHVPATPVENEVEKQGDVVILTDADPEDAQLAAMIARFRGKLPRGTRVVNLWEYPFKGGCLGCFNCAVSGKCIYKDGFDEYLRNEIQTAQAIVFAFSIKDHSMGARFKMYDDRQFCNGHRTVTVGMPMGYLISGNYSKEFNLQTVVEARAQVGGNILAGIATDEQNTDTSIDNLVKGLVYALEHPHVPSKNFYNVGGMKIFRDLIYTMRGMMRADHKFYKSHGYYDFPQKNKGTIIKMYLVGSLLKNKKLKAKMGSAMTDGMLMPYNKLFEQMDKGQ